MIEKIDYFKDLVKRKDGEMHFRTIGKFVYKDQAIGGKDGWYKFLNNLVNFIEIYNKYFTALPTKEELKTIGNTLQRLRKTFDRHTAYQKQIPSIRNMEMITRSLVARRKTTTKTPTINTDLNRLVCEQLFKAWCMGEEDKKPPTGTYNNRLDHGADREELDRFDHKKNPGAYFIQAVFEEYCSLKLDNKQIKDLILATTKNLSGPLGEPIIDEPINADTFPFYMGWWEDTFVPHSKEELERRAKEKKK